MPAVRGSERLSRLRLRHGSHVAGRACLAVLAMQLAGCAAPKAARVDGEHASVHASTTEIAADLSERADQLVVRIRAILPDASVPPLEIHVDGVRPSRAGQSPAYTVRHVDGGGATTRASIHLAPGSVGDDHVLAHELAHALAGPSWSTLPPLLAEGLCESIAAELVPTYGDRVAPWHVAIVLLSIDARLEIYFSPGGGAARSPPPTSVSLAIAQDEKLDLRSAYELTTDDLHDRGGWGAARAAYGFGYLMVRSIVTEHGIDALHRLCREAAADGRAHVALDDVLALCGLVGAAPGDLTRWVTRQATESDLRVLGRVVKDAFGQVLASDYRGAYGDLSGRVFVSLYGARFRLAGGHASVALVDTDGVLAALDALWPAGSRDDGYDP